MSGKTMEAINARIKFLGFLLLLTWVGFGALLVFILTGGNRDQAVFGSLTAKSLAIVDDNGTSRVILGAPVPDPLINGKPAKRRSSSTGMTLHDENGNEVGGFGLLADGTRSFALDGPTGEGGYSDRIALVVWPDGTPQLVVRGDKKTSRIVIGGFLNDPDYGLVLLDDAWHITGALKTDPEGKTRFKILDLEGNPLAGIPED